MRRRHRVIHLDERTSEGGSARRFEENSIIADAFAALPGMAGLGMLSPYSPVQKLRGVRSDSEEHITIVLPD